MAEVVVFMRAQRRAETRHALNARLEVCALANFQSNPKIQLVCSSKYRMRLRGMGLSDGAALCVMHLDIIRTHVFRGANMEVARKAWMPPCYTPLTVSQST